MGGAMQSGAQHPAQPAASAAGGAMPDVMNPAQAAAYLQVTEADVLQMIQSGQIKAKQIGAQYRISKSALDEYLKS
jgi:excisionase family DNA binding protein